MGVCTKEWKGDTAEVLMATPCTNSLGGESGGQKPNVTSTTQMKSYKSLRQLVTGFQRLYSMVPLYGDFQLAAAEEVSSTTTWPGHRLDDGGFLGQWVSHD